MLISHHDLGEEEGLSAGLRLAHRVFCIHQAGRATGLSEAINLCNIDAHFLVSLRQGNGYRCRACHEGTYARPVVIFKVRYLDHEIQHRRHHQATRDLLALYAFPCRDRVKAPHNVGRCTVVGVNREWG